MLSIIPIVCLALRSGAPLPVSPPATDPALPASRDISVAFRFGTLGLGAEVGKLISGHLSGRVGANFFKVSTSKTQTDISYAATLKLQGVSVLADLYPARRGSFHFTAGIVTDPAKVDGTGEPTGGDFKINGNHYTPSQVGTLSAELRFPSVGPYAGIGFGTPAARGRAVKFLFDLGVVFGKPTLSLTATGAASNQQLAADLEAQRLTTQHDVRKLKVYPVLDFGLAYRF